MDHIMYIGNGKPFYASGIVFGTAFETGIRRLDWQGSPQAEGVSGWRFVIPDFWGDRHE
jgi:hypothetical protein